MAIFPKIESPCPYRDRLASVMDGDHCRMCDRRVHDLTALDDAARVAFFAGCAGEPVCVSYRLPIRRAVVAAALALAAPLPAAAAQDEEIEIIVGGIRAPGDVVFVDDPADARLPELPVVTEDAPPPVTGKAPVQPTRG